MGVRGLPPCVFHFLERWADLKRADLESDRLAGLDEELEDVGPAEEVLAPGCGFPVVGPDPHCQVGEHPGGCRRSGRCRLDRSRWKGEDDRADEGRPGHDSHQGLLLRSYGAGATGVAREGRDREVPRSARGIAGILPTGI